VTRTRFFATCGRGIEPILAEELRALQASEVTPGRGGVSFEGDRRLLYQANLWLRTAVRVLQPILEAEVGSPDELYEAVRAFDWSKHLTPDHTLAVDCNVRDSAITHSKYAALRVKDAICDQFMDKVHRRPSVDVEEPMVGFNLHVYRNHAVLSLDSSVTSLHKRGYRPIQTKAPLNEALAAAILLSTGWRGEVPLVDPMCGAGTFLIEGAWIALRRPPGLTRRRYGFMGWMDYDVRLWTSLRDEARAGVLARLPAPVIGKDIRRDAVAFARTNARAAGVGNLISISEGDLRDFQLPTEPGVLLCNPPYGERLGSEKELRPLYQLLGEVLRQRCSGWQAFVFTGNRRLAGAMGIQPKARTPLFNGKIPCELLHFDFR
jgi:putative N6-adenine-specific DNA methylase